MEQQTIFLEKPHAFALGDEIREKISDMNAQDFKLTSISVWTHHQTYVNYAVLVFSKK